MSKFKVGDTVMVRHWDDMAREYGTCGDDYIGPHEDIFFNTDMRKYCGKIAKIEEIGFVGNIVLTICHEWRFSDWMLILVEAAEETPASEEKTDEEPKACPLCGGQVEAYTGGHKAVRKSLFVENILRCKDCGLELKRKTKINCNGGGVIHDGYAEVVADWNRRAGNENPM